MSEPALSPQSKAHPIANFLRVAMRRDVVLRSAKVAIIVGLILNVINQGHNVMQEGSLDVVRCLMTFCVPYCVSTYASVSSILAAQANV